MSYEKQNFVDGQVLSAKHLNHIEDGIENLEKSGGATVTIDVASLPTSEVNENVLYRLLRGTITRNQILDNQGVCYCVDDLPEIGAPFCDLDWEVFNLYYNVQDDLVYGYLDETLAATKEVSVGWYDCDTLMGNLWGGFLASLEDDPKDGKYRILLNYDVYSCKKGVWTSLSGAASSWDDLEDKPFGRVIADGEFTYTFDGDLTGKEYVSFGESRYYVKVSDHTPGKSDFVGKDMTTVNQGTAQTATLTEELLEQLSADLTPNGDYVLSGSGFTFDLVLVAYETLVLQPEGVPITLTPGVWVTGIPDLEFYVSRVTYDFNGETIVCLDEEFIPTTVARIEDVEAMINEALGGIENGTY